VKTLVGLCTYNFTGIKVKLNPKDKVHPRTDHEGPEEEE
jgi:hypothetical protein